MKASLSHYQQAPRKVRLLADLVRGKKAVEAVSILSFTDKRASLPMQKMILSAIANAVTNFNTPQEELIIAEISVNKGRVLKRSMPRARGSAFPIRLRSSHVEVILGKVGEAKSVVPKAVKATKVEKDAKTTKSVSKPKTIKAKKTKAE
jgi:large subunit ribosomal protein L22